MPTNPPTHLRRRLRQRCRNMRFASLTEACGNLGCASKLFAIVLGGPRCHRLSATGCAGFHIIAEFIVGRFLRGAMRICTSIGEGMPMPLGDASHCGASVMERRLENVSLPRECRRSELQHIAHRLGVWLSFLTGGAAPLYARCQVSLGAQTRASQRPFFRLGGFLASL